MTDKDHPGQSKTPGKPAERSVYDVFALTERGSSFFEGAILSVENRKRQHNGQNPAQQRYNLTVDN